MQVEIKINGKVFTITGELSEVKETLELILKNEETQDFSPLKWVEPINVPYVSPFSRPYIGDPIPNPFGIGDDIQPYVAKPFDGVITWRNDWGRIDRNGTTSGKIHNTFTT